MTMKTLKEFNAWLEEEQSFEFSIEKLKKIGTGPVSQETQVEIYRYLQKTLGQSSWSGSFRYTWPLDDQRVLKLIKGVDRISQNQQELKNSRCLGHDYAVQVLDYHPQFYWLIEERVEHLSDEQFVAEFNKKLGTNFGESVEGGHGGEMSTSFMITTVISNIVGGHMKRNDSYFKFYPYFLKSEWFAPLAEKLETCQVSSDDFHNENWGIRPGTGELVLLDLGF